ncbi:DUF4097 family beta strand repeat-containing protein [Streptomyces natalensis]|uniref:DUF4097 domain-containing protein n=1 Tax=Streptomyces natalensis ATCC 27448 TaxID=1240678 RepID=A0A0D7CQI3_9ACTN|nr:DUF4097 family beta strand repeat-containing protein [Streptomyces natalensis]KIZ18494.1 hypothetical protein SNA_07760 [Streptomyces natalensis ATCC 27448]
MARLRSFPLVVFGAALAVGGSLTACSAFGPTQRAQRTYTVDDKITALTATTHGGNIEIVPIAAGGKVKVTEKYEYNDTKPHPAHTVENGRLTLEAADCSGSGERCSVAYRVLLPRKASVDLHTSGGDITVRGTSGAISAETSGGDVTVADSTARTAEVKTSGGDVDVTMASAPDKLSGQTSGGDVTIRLPKTSYAVDASTSGGTRKVSVPTDGGSAHKITARTSGGDVSVEPATS